MRILITGATGHLAQHVIRELENEHELVLFGRARASERRLPAADRHPFVSGDLKSGDDCIRAVTGCSAIVHLGGVPYASDALEIAERFRAEGRPVPPPDETMRVNVVGTFNVMHAAVRAGVQVVLAVTSNAVLGHSDRISGRPFPIRYLPIDEEHPREPENSYALSKSLQEQVLETFARAHGVRAYALRPAWIWPPELEREHADSVEATTAWSPDLLNGYVSALDVARCLRMCLQAHRALPQFDAYYVNAADTVALEDSLDLLRRFRPELLEVVRELSGRAALISTARASRAFGWRPQKSWTRFLPSFDR